MSLEKNITSGSLQPKYLTALSAIFVLLVLLIPSLSLAAVHVEWGYSSPPANLAGFRLYLDGTQICETTDPNARQMDCAYTPPTGQLTFSMTAFDTSNNESSFSTPYAVDNSTTPPANNAPVAQNGSFSTTEDIPVSSSLSATDQDGDSLAYSMVSSSSKGSVSLNANGAFTYTPNADVNGTDSFTFKVNDGTVDSNTATVTITITAANDAPVAGNDTASTSQGQAVSIQALTNDNDVDNDTLSLSAVTNGNNGTTAISGSTIVYTPAATFYGTDSFTYTVSDGQGGTDTASVTVSVAAIVVNDTTPPIVTAPANITVDATGVLTSVSLGNATANDNADGNLTAYPGETGPFRPGKHTITWTATDSAGNSATANQTVEIIPMVNFGLDQETGQNGKVTVTAYLNGDACQYPVEVPYSVRGTARYAVDHNAGAGTIIINSGLKASITFDAIENTQSTKDETVIFDMGTPVNAVQGPKSKHTVTIIKTNAAPLVTLEAVQNSNATKAIANDLGQVDVIAYISDPNPADTHTVSWEVSNSSITSLGNTSPFYDAVSGKTVSIFTFNPASLNQKLTTFKIHVNDDGSPSKSTSAELQLNSVGNAPTLLASVDSDGDGVSDAAEGFGDSDYDGILDHLDAVSVEELLQTQQGGGYRYLMETEAGLKLQLGSVALSVDKSGALVSENDILLYEGQGGNVTTDTTGNLSEIFDFKISGLPQTGQSAKVVLPLSQPVPQNPVYRKCISAATGWVNYVIDNRNSVASAPGEAGICPPPGDGEYTEGLTPGDYCVQLTIEDGGPNDADGAANGIIEDPSGVDFVSGISGSSGFSGSAGAALSGGGGGGGCTLNTDGRVADPSLPILVLLAAIFLLRRRKNAESC